MFSKVSELLSGAERGRKGGVLILTGKLQIFKCESLLNPRPLTEEREGGEGGSGLEGESGEENEDESGGDKRARRK